jgi:hypothetical protein
MVNTTQQAIFAFSICAAITKINSFPGKLFHHEGHEEDEEKSSSWIFKNFVLFVLSW